MVWRAVANVNVSHCAESEKWNVTTLIWRGIFLSLQRFIAPALDLIPLLQAVGERDSKKGAVNCCNETKIYSKIKMCVQMAQKVGNV